MYEQQALEKNQIYVFRRPFLLDSICDPENISTYVIKQINCSLVLKDNLETDERIAKFVSEIWSSVLSKVQSKASGSL